MHLINTKKEKIYIENLPALKIARSFRTPFYCYSLNQLKKNFLNFKKVFSAVSPLICFSIKANSNLHLLRHLKEIGSGADVVSLGELKKALKAGINPKKIVFSGIGKTEEEIVFAIKKNILLINIESASEAKLINKIANKLSKKVMVGIRLNPNVSANTHKKISTGLRNEKFGLLEKNFLELCKKINSYNKIYLNSLSVHIGSQITELKPFYKMLSVISKVIKKSKIKFDYVDLGGGIGISYLEMKKKFNFKKYANAVKKFQKLHGCKIIFEPGRIIAANTSILISKVIYIKNSNGTNFIIIDAGMNDLMRPALYGAKHQILPLKKSKSYFNKTCEFVGPICESSDKFLKVKNFFTLKEGDYICLTNVGAYGSTLSSNYNSRPLSAEILVDKKKIKVIKKRQNLDQIVNV